MITRRVIWYGLDGTYTIINLCLWSIALMATAMMIEDAIGGVPLNVRDAFEEALSQSWPAMRVFAGYVVALLVLRWMYEPRSIMLITLTLGVGLYAVAFSIALVSIASRTIYLFP